MQKFVIASLVSFLVLILMSSNRLQYFEWSSRPLVDFTQSLLA